MKPLSFIMILAIGLSSVGASASFDDYQGPAVGAMLAGATTNALINVVSGGPTVMESAVATAGGALVGAAMTAFIGPAATGLVFGGLGMISSLTLGTFNTGVLYFRPSCPEAREGVQKSGQALTVSALTVAASVVVAAVKWAT